MVAWKEAKEAFVSGNAGGSAVEVAVIAAVGEGLAMILARTAASAGAGVLGEWAAIVLPLALLTTLLSDHVYSAALAILAIALTASWLLNARRQKQKKERVSSWSGRRLASLTEVRAAMTFGTAFAIFAVDFIIFPRRFGKTETRGNSLMDFGVGAFVLCSGLSHGCALVRRAAAVVAEKKPLAGFPWRAVLALTAMGLVRVVAVKASGYPEHESEYGVHWNFFLTLAVTATVTGFFASSSPLLDALAALAVSVVHQFGLSAGIGDWVLARGAERQPLPCWIPLPSTLASFVELNREGICSLPGYIAFALIGMALGKAIFSQRTELRAAIFAAAVGLASQCACKIIGGSPSRVLADLPYILHCTAVFMFLAILLATNVIFPHLGPPSTAVEGASSNMLATFLFANALTGIVNLSINTAAVGSAPAYVIVLTYSFVVVAFAYFCGRRKLRLLHF